MHWLLLLLLCVIPLVFLVAVYAGVRSWAQMRSGKRFVSVLLLTPHFLLLACIVISMLCGQPPQGSELFNIQFFCSVLMVFILPVPALIGTPLAIAIFV